MFCPCLFNIYGRLVRFVRCSVSTDRSERVNIRKLVFKDAETAANDGDVHYEYTKLRTRQHYSTLNTIIAFFTHLTDGFHGAK